MNLLNLGKIKKIKQWKKSTKLVLLLAVLVAAGGIVYWQISKQGEQEEAIITTRVKKGKITDSITLSGQVEQSNLISVFTKASGVVKQIYVTDGQQVKAGDKLAEIILDSEGKTNQAQAWSQYLSAKNSVSSAQNELNSLESKMWAANDNFIHNAVDLGKDESESEYIQANRDWAAAENNYLNQKNKISQAQASTTQAWNNYQLYQSAITAPVDGKIISLNLAPGLTVSYSESNSGGSASQIVGRIQTEGKPVLSFSATEVDINKIKVDQTVTVEFDSLEEHSYSGKVVAVDRVGEETSGVTQYQILVLLDEKNEEILSNMSATAELIFNEKDDILSVPISAITQGREGKQFISILENGQPRPIEVETGLETDTEIEIVSGLSEGDEILVSGSTQSSSKTGSDQRMPGSMPPGSFGGMGR